MRPFPQIKFEKQSHELKEWNGKNASAKCNKTCHDVECKINSCCSVSFFPQTKNDEREPNEISWQKSWRWKLQKNRMINVDRRRKKRSWNKWQTESYINKWKATERNKKIFAEIKIAAKEWMKIDLIQIKKLQKKRKIREKRKLSVSHVTLVCNKNKYIHRHTLVIE